MFSGEFLLNFWCVAGRTEDFARDLRPLRLFGRDVVFFRRLDGGGGAVSQTGGTDDRGRTGLGPGHPPTLLCFIPLPLPRLFRP